MEVTKSFNPVTGEEIGQVPLSTVEELKEVILKARAAQADWESISINERIKHIKRIRFHLIEKVDQLSETISRENGKLRIDALATEVIPSAMYVNYYCRKAKTFLKDQPAGFGCLFTFYKRSKVVRVPYGVIGIISPWNYPFSIPFYQIIMALLAGNAVILKVAKETVLIGDAIKESVAAANLPEDLFSLVNLPGRVAGDAMLANGIDKMLFTGSVEVGKKVMAKAAETLTPVNLELGGNDAMIVCEDADLHRAAGGAVWAGLSNAGQSCGGVERLYVHENVYDSFMRILKQKVESMRVGYDTDYCVDMGAITTEKQKNSVEAHINDAKKQGAIVFAQSQIPYNAEFKNFVPATILSNVNHQMDVMRDETFGPVVGVMRYKSIEQAIELANDSYLGLTGSVWSKNRRKAEKIGRRIKAGVISINDHLSSHGLPETFWGGFKQSGIGRSHGREGFNDMTQTQMVVHDYLPFLRKNLWWPPYNEKIYRGLKGGFKLFYGRGLVERLKSVFPFVKILPRMFRE